MKKTVMLVFALVSAAAFAAVPVKWVVETSQLEPSTFDVVRGESLSIEANFMSYGSQLDMGRYPCSIFWQTNGMGSAWWIAPATVSKPSGTSVSNVVTAVFTPQMDPGTKTVSGFIGSTGEIYRAAFTLRFRPGPGAAPNALPVPTKFIDWATVDNVNASAAPFVLRGEGGLTSNDVARISAVTVTNDVAPWAMAGKSEPQGMTTNAVEEISSTQITNSVQSGYICTVEAARGMTNSAVATAKAYADGKFLQVTYFNGSPYCVGNFNVTENLGVGGEINASTIKRDNSPVVYSIYAGGIGRNEDVDLDNVYLGLGATAHNSERLNGHTESQVVEGLINAQTATNIAEDVISSQFTTNNEALVSVVTNLAPSKARGISLADPVRHCNWYQSVTNGVFFWLVEE